MHADVIPDTAAGPRESLVLSLRLAAALIQGTALYLLTGAAESPASGLAAEPRLFVPCLLLAVLVPPGVMLGLADLRVRPLAIWIAVAALIVAALGYHDAARGVPVTAPGRAVVWPGYRLCVSLAASLLIAHVLVVGAIAERRLTASYARLFDTASKLGAQIALAGIFVGLFWGMLVLGAGLFKLVDIDVILKLIMNRVLPCFATPLAFAISIHVTDMQPALIRGVRSLALTLFSWLLPVLAAILLGFLVTLPFISLAPLWKTHFATGLLIDGAVSLIFLINCCYQDGRADPPASRIRRVAGTLCAIELPVLAGLAIWGLSLRVEQYGWTVERIFAAATIAVVSCLAVGYASAAVRRGAWLKHVETANVLTAYGGLALVLALFSPVADPARLMVADQTARLVSGAVPPDKFDFAALRFDGARWGARALADLSRIADRPDAAAIRTRAERALALTSRAGWSRSVENPTGRIAVYPAGRNLPDVFSTEQFWQAANGTMPTCFLPGASRCIARFVALQPGEAEVIVFFGLNGDFVFEQDATAGWHSTGRITGPMFCEPARQSLERGDFALEPHAWPDLIVAGQRLAITPVPGGCPPLPSRSQPPKARPKP